jgi:hypothetical protein
MAWAPTTDQLLDLDGVRRRADSFRFVLLDKEEQDIGELHPDLDSPPTMKFDSSGSVQRTMSNFNITAIEAGDINPLSDRLRPEMVLQNGAVFPLGIMLWGDDSEPLRPWGPERASELVDKMNILNQGIRQTFGLGKGADIGLAVLGVALAYLPIEQIDVDSISADLGVGTTWALGTAGSKVLTDLLKNVGFLRPYFDLAGHLRMRDTPDVASASPSLVYEAGGRIIADSILDSNDALRAPNLYKALDPSGQAPVVGTYQIPASEPHSFENRGFYVLHEESIQGLKDTARANRAAKALAVTAGRGYRFRSFESTIDPRHDGSEVLTVIGETWMEDAHSFPMISGGKMSHSLRRVA